MKSTVTTPDYAAFLTEVKGRIHSARLNAGRAVNRELIALYWDIGKAIVEKQKVEGWGESVVERLAADLRAEFPDMRGFSTANLWAMRRFFVDYGRDPILQQLAEELTERKLPRFPRAEDRRRAVSGGSRASTAFLQQLAEEIPWGHHMMLLDKVKETAARLYYLRATAQFGWSRAVLRNQIKAQAYERAKAEKKTHNFAVALPEHFAEQADEMLKTEDVEVEFALKTKANPIGVAEYQLQSRLPAEFKGKLPTAKQLADVVRSVLPEQKQK